MNKPVIQTKQTRKKFDKAFKQHAVELWLNGGKSATEIYAETGIATSASGFPAEKGRLKGFIVSDEVLDVLTEEEILDAVKRHWSGDPGERECLDDGKLGLESLFTVRKERVIVLTNPSRAQTNIWLESECLF
jgi:hypothetical protein